MRVLRALPIFLILAMTASLTLSVVSEKYLRHGPSAQAFDEVPLEVLGSPGVDKDKYLSLSGILLGEYERKVAELIEVWMDLPQKKKDGMAAAITSIRHRINAANEALEQVRATPSPEWRTLRPGINEALQDLETAYRQALMQIA